MTKPQNIWLWVLLVLSTCIAIFCFYVELQRFRVIVIQEVHQNFLLETTLKTRKILGYHENYFNPLLPDSLKGK